MARDNSRVAQALLIIAREHSGPSAKGREPFLGAWRSLLRRRVLQKFLHLFAWRGQNVVYQLTVKSIS
jgi:hypothetical protein